MITRDDIVRLGELARLKIAEADIGKLQKDLGAIVDYVSELQKVAPEQLPDESTLNVLRSDTNPHASGQYTERLLASVPKRSGNYLVVKKIIDNGKH